MNPNPTDAPSDESLVAQSARLRVQFLDRELELTQTMIELARFEGDDATSKSRAHIRQALDTIRKFLGEVASPEDHARIANRLEKLEADVAANGTGKAAR